MQAMASQVEREKQKLLRAEATKRQEEEAEKVKKATFSLIIHT